jgi:hypothetical protein
MSLTQKERTKEVDQVWKREVEEREERREGREGEGKAEYLLVTGTRREDVGLVNRNIIYII